MKTEPQTYKLDPMSPGYELLRRILRILALPWLIAVVVLFAIGSVQVFPALMLVAVAVIGAVVIPAALRRFPGEVTIGPNGLTTAAKRGSITIPWADIDTIEVRPGGDQSFRELYDFLRVDSTPEFVYVGIRPNSKTMQTARSLRNVSLYVLDPQAFAEAAIALQSGT
ncbi:MAG: hypothetical protein ABI559_04785 [Chloroflexota bacterium]